MSRFLNALLTTDPRLRRSLMTTGLACLFMALCVLAMQLAVAAGLAQPGPVHWWSVASAGCVVLSFVLIRSGLTRHWHDPAFTMVQISCALISNAVAYAIAGEARGIGPPVLAVVMMFGVFGLTPAQIKKLLVLGTVVFATAGAIVQWGHPEDAPPPALAALYMLMVVLVLVFSTMLALHMEALRTQLKIQRRELALAIEREQELATRDELTGLPNRRYLAEAMRIRRLNAQRTGQPLLLAQLDLDFFKSINDTYGHAAGDIALQGFAKIVSGQVRASDILARWGGEEFVLLMCDTSVSDGAAVLERVRAAVASTPVILPEGRRIRFSVSIGAVQWQPGEASAALLARADAALYEAKHQGRNRVVWA